jgi:hypothetical protein
MFTPIRPELVKTFVLPVPVPEGGSTWMYFAVMSLVCGAMIFLKNKTAWLRRG